MSCLLVCSSSDETTTRIQNICKSVGWDTIITHLDVNTAQLLLEQKADAAILDLEHEGGDLRAFVSFLAGSFPFFPLVLMHKEEITQMKVDSSLQFHVQPNRIEELEHILISISIMTHSSVEPLPQCSSTSNNVPRVLIVDDDVALASTLARSLRIKERFDVQTAHSGFQAGAILPIFLPDVAIVDISLGDIDGREVCNFIRQNRKLKRTKVIGISGVIDPDALEKSTCSFDDFLVKPFRMREIVKRVEDYLAPEDAATL